MKPNPFPRGRGLLCSLLLLLGLLPAVRAIDLPEPTLIWTGAVDGNWANPANWSPARVPAAADHVAIEVRGVSETVTISTAVTVASLRVGTTGGDAPEVRLASGRNLTLSVGGDIGLTGRFVQSGSLFGPLEVGGWMQWNDGRVWNTVTVVAGGRLEVTGEVQLANSGGPPAQIENQGTLVLAANIVMWNLSLITNRGLLEFPSDGGFLTYCCGGGAGTLVNRGTVAKTGGHGRDRDPERWPGPGRRAAGGQRPV